MSSLKRDIHGSYEPLRHNTTDFTQVVLRPVKSNPQYANNMMPSQDRPTVGTPSSKVPTPGSAMTGRSTLYQASFEDRDMLDRRSQDPRASGRKQFPPARRTTSVQTQNGGHTTADDSDGTERGQEGYFDQAVPSPMQFLSNRGRPMSFYDMKEQTKQAKMAALGGNRFSWRSSDMPFHYADIIGDNRHSYVPPAMGRDPMRKKHSHGMSPMRLPWTMWMNSEAKNLFVAALGEWVGTTMFLFFAFAGTQVANAQSKTPGEATTTNATTGFDPVVMLYISLSFGFSLMVNVWVFFRISGGLFNPAVTLALWATRALGGWRALCLFVAQIVGSITASALVLAIFPTPLNVRTTLSEGTSLAQGLFVEAFMTAELVFTILMLAKEKHKSTFIAPVGIGLALFVAEMVGVYYTGGSLNPARSFGPCVITGSFDPEHWIYWLGPAIGCLFAICFYKFIKTLEYEMANPGQDGDDENDPTKNPNHEVREKQREMTTRVLASLGLENPGVRSDGGSASNPERQAEEGAYMTSRASSAIGDGDERYGHVNPQALAALSTVPSMSDMNSPARASFHQHHSHSQVTSARNSMQGESA